jgi:hypothetical protein
MSDAMRSRQWRSHYAHTIDRLDKTGEIVERLAGVEDLEVAEATWRAAIK